MSLNRGETMSQQLRRRRLALGLSLADVARRARTSAATLSRYEHGWTRFETYTLRKLARALACELRIELKPQPAILRTPVAPAVARTRLKRLFWDHPLTAGDIEKHRVWVMERVLEYGTLADVQTLRDVLGHDEFLKGVGDARRLSPRTRSFWTQILALEGMRCTKKYSRVTAWNC